MIVKGNFEYLGMNEFQGKKDPTKTYFSANLLHGSEVLKVFLSEGQDILFVGLEKMDELEVELDIKIGAKTYVSIVSVLQLENGKPVNNKDNKASA